MAFTFHIVIPDPSGTRVLLVEDGTGWVLPRVSSAERYPDRFVVAGVSEAAGERFGLDIALLRSVLGGKAAAEHSDDAFLFAENLNTRLVGVGEWTSEDALRERALSDEREDMAVRQWFAERRDGGPEQLQQWQREGWFSAAASWIDTALPDVTGVQQYVTWCSSSLLRVVAGGRRYYFKAAPDFFHLEASVTAMLAELFPDAVPRPVAIDTERGWMLLEDIGDTLVGGMELAHWERALDALLEIQRSSVPHVDFLLRGGCSDRRAAVLETQIEDLAQGMLGELPDGIADRLRAAVPRYRSSRRSSLDRRSRTRSSTGTSTPPTW
jgi:hypothetical protein